MNVAPVKLTVLRWQVSHGSLVGTWLLFLPGAVVPLWQDAQFDVMPVWLNMAPMKLTVLRWQVSHGSLVGTWLLFLP
ncbi:MAG TPA: hypothetical protein VKA94_00180, partial [Hyphomicrobiales bacterium]|nr:hypothetical protein [Hyphomicrobiales bacterium]